MQFVTNKISTGNKRTLDDIIASYGKKEVNVKTASVEKPITKMSAPNEDGPTSGQPQAEAKLVNKPERSDVPASGGSKKQDEAPSSGQPEAEAKLVNEPEKDKEAKTTVEIKEAELTPAQEKLPEALKEKIRAKQGDKKDDDEKEEKTAAIDEPGKRDGTGPYDPDATEEEKEEAKKNKGDRKGKRQLDGEECPNASDKEASSKMKFVKIANLDDKTKTWLSDYWKNLYPAEYVDALLADK